MNNYEENTLSYENFNENYFLSNQYLPGMSEQDFEIADINGDFKPDFIYMGFNEGYAENPVGANRVIAGWSPSPDDQGLYMFPYIKLTAPVDLSSSVEVNGETRKVLLSWNEPLNIGLKKSTTYNLALRNKTTGKWLYNPMATMGGENDGWRKVNRMGNMFLNKKVEVNLPDGNYEWTVQAVDAAKFGGHFAPVKALNLATGVDETVVFKPAISIEANTLKVSYDSNEEIGLKIYSVLGRKVMDKRFTAKISLTLEQGVYIVQLKGESGNFTTKIVVR